MSSHERIVKYFSENIETQQEILSQHAELIEFASQRLAHALLNDNKIIACGCGGNAYNAIVLTASLLNRFERDRPSLPALALTDQMTLATALSADNDNDEVFAKPIRALGHTGDVLVLYSIGSLTANMVKAIQSAHDKGMAIVALTGAEAGKSTAVLKENDLELRVASPSSAHVMESHLTMTHCLCGLIDYQIFGP